MKASACSKIATGGPLHQTYSASYAPEVLMLDGNSQLEVDQGAKDLPITPSGDFPHVRLNMLR